MLSESQKIITGSEGLLSSNAKKALRQQLRNIVTQWAIEHIPKPPPDIREPSWIEEAITIDGKVLRGVFVRQDKNLWKRYNNPTSARRGGTGWDPVRTNKLESGPQKSIHFRSIQQYNAKVSQLSRDVFSRNNWQELEWLCGRLDTEFAKYLKKSGANKKPLSFDAGRKMAKEVLRQWTAIKKLKDK